MDRLHKTLTFRQLVILGLLFIGPGAPVGLFGVLEAMSHGATALVYLIATGVMGLTAWAYARMSRELPHAGAVYAYCSAGIHPHAGFLVGWMLLLDYLFIPAVAYLFCGISLNAIMPAVPVWGWTLLALLSMSLLNLLGFRKSMRITLAILAVEIGVLILVIFAGLIFLWHHGPQRELWSPLLGDGTTSLKAVLSAVSVAVLSYLGFDAIATFAEENREDRTMIGKAIVVCLLLVGVLFIVQTWIGALISPWSARELQLNPAQQGKAFYDLVSRQLGTELGVALGVVKAVGAAFAAMVGQAAAGRLLYSMARDHRLPAVLAKTGRRSGVPVRALVIAAFCNLLLAIAAASHPDGLTWLVSLVDIGALSAFILLQVAVIGYFRIKQGRRGGRSVWQDVIVPVTGIAVLLPVLAHITTVALKLGLSWLVIGLIALWLNHRRAHAPQEQA